MYPISYYDSQTTDRYCKYEIVFAGIAIWDIVYLIHNIK